MTIAQHTVDIDRSPEALQGMRDARAEFEQISDDAMRAARERTRKRLEEVGRRQQMQLDLLDAVETASLVIEASHSANSR